LEFDTFYLVNVYAPHSHRKLTRLQLKLSFGFRLVDYLRELRTKKPIILTGDLNVAHKEIDLANPSANRLNAGFLQEERKWFSSLLELGFADGFRIFESGSGHYTWWSTRQGVRARNVGWRLDYILVDNVLVTKVCRCFHWTEQRGSDHCPVTIDIDL